jgi:hypothetical protein
VSPPSTLILLDTNVHSDWASEPCRLPESVTSGLSAALQRPEVELVIPGEQFVEFSWPPDKQYRWLERVGSRIQSVLVALKNPVVWELENAVADLRGKGESRYPFQRYHSQRLFADMTRWHPSRDVALVRTALNLYAEAAEASRQAEAKPSDISKRDFATLTKQREMTVAQFLSSSTGIEQIRNMLKSDDFKGLLQQQMQSFASLGAELPSSIDEVLDHEVSGSLARMELLSSPAVSGNYGSQRDFLQMTALVGSDVSGEECLAVFERFQADPGRLPAFGVYAQVSRSVNRQRERKSRASDVFDLRILPWMAYCDFVTTDADMAQMARTCVFPDVRGRLYSRQELERLVVDLREAST